MYTVTHNASRNHKIAILLQFNHKHTLNNNSRLYVILLFVLFQYEAKTIQMVKLQSRYSVRHMFHRYRWVPNEVDVIRGG